jgi:protein-arginine kinase activator protein McsA
MKAPIFVSSEVIEKAAVKIEDESQFEASELTLLNEQLLLAIEIEDYENAAVLRDKIRMLQKKKDKN